MKEALTVNTSSSFNTHIAADEVPDCQSLQGNKIKAIIIIVLSFQSLNGKQEVSPPKKTTPSQTFSFLKDLPPVKASGLNTFFVDSE